LAEQHQPEEIFHCKTIKKGDKRMFHIIWMLVVGLIAGALARLFVPGKDPMSIWMTILLGVAGSFVGGFVSRLIWPIEGRSLIHPAGIVMSVLGAILLLVLWHLVRPKAA
jgi:uncharacterized membrane protein YeaQ/YmgE (transglycosylase-associated protein family)